MEDIRKIPERTEIRRRMTDYSSDGTGQEERLRPGLPTVPFFRGTPLPFYMTAGIPLTGENPAARDLEYLLWLYPLQARRLQQKISRRLDMLDYRGSLIYDEYPDRMALERLADEIGEQIRMEESAEESTEEKEEDGQAETEGRKAMGEDRRDLIRVLLYYEIFRRRQGMNAMNRQWPFME